MSAPPVLMTFPVGTDFDRVLQLTTDGTSPLTSYLNTDALTAVLWPGADQASLASAPAVSWVDASVAKFLVSFTASVTTSLSLGIYRCQVKATRGGRTTVIADFGVELTEAPGTATALKSYCSYADLLKYAPWVAKLQDSQDQAGFARERNDARLWFEDLIHRHWRGGQGLSPDLFFVPGVAFGGLARYVTIFRTGARSTTLQGWLDSGGPGNGDGLIVTSQIIEANACYAIHRIAGNQVSPTKDSTYGHFATLFGIRADTAASLITAEIDSNNDGVSDAYVRLGVHDTLEG